MMTIEAKELVQKIQQANEEVVFLKREISEVEHEKLYEIVQYALKGLEFEGIHKSLAYYDEHSQTDSELFEDEHGNVLKGVKVLDFIEDGDVVDEIDWELCKEVFLISDGSLKTFDTIYLKKECSECDVIHLHLERQEASVDYESENKIEAIINNILDKLNSAYESSIRRKSRLSDRLDKLKEIRVS